MSSRSLDDYQHERAALDAAHAQNEAGRDAFIAIAHTALFAASVSFVGDVAPLQEAIWRPALILGWTFDVTGLLALTFSFTTARRAIDARRAALNEPDPPAERLTETLNSIALWSFPLALLCLFSFVTANVVTADDRQSRQTSPPPAAQLRATGSHSATTSSKPRRPASLDRSHSASENALGASADANSITTSAEEMRR
jgi:hypothetical protein